MRLLIAGLAVALASAASASAQPAAVPPPTKTFTSAAEVAALLAKARTERKADQPTLSQRLITLAPYGVNLEYRGGVGPAAVHETRAELFHVVEGSGTLVTGGKLRDEKRTDAENLSGAGIDGGETRKVGKGDYFIVPEKTPHWFSVIDKELVLMSVHVPRRAP
jgi:mannose-6-phosphate isomerase-like protein (cupin superfamily)